MELYKKIVSPSGRISYQVIKPVDETPVVYDLTDAQALTAAGALGVTLLMIFEKFLPEHSRNGRKIKAVENAILGLYQGSGAEIDDAIATWICNCWDQTMRTAEFGEVAK